MKTTLTSALLLAAQIACFAQKQNTYYVKDDGSYVSTRDSADFVRLIQEPDAGSDLYSVFDLYKDGTKKLIGKSSRVRPVVFQGQVARFYPDGKKMQVANYTNNHLTGLFYQYYPNGKIFSVVQFDEPIEGGKSRYNIISCLDNDGHEMVTDGNGHYKGFDGGGDGILEEGDVKNGLREGDWKGSVAQGGLSFTEHYEHGQLIKGIATDKTGVTHIYTQRSNHAYYHNGNKALATFLINQANFFAKDETIFAKGTVIVSFYLDEKGRISDIKLANSESATMNVFVVRAVATSAKGWVPAAFFGITRKEYVSFPFSLDSVDMEMYY